jgi:hypothetical protein
MTKVIVSLSAVSESAAMSPGKHRTEMNHHLKEFESSAKKYKESKHKGDSGGAATHLKSMHEHAKQAANHAKHAFEIPYDGHRHLMDKANRHFDTAEKHGEKMELGSNAREHKVGYSAHNKAGEVLSKYAHTIKGGPPRARGYGPKH